MPRVIELKDLLPSLEERESVRMFFRRLERALVDNQNVVGQSIGKSDDVLAALASAVSRLDALIDRQPPTVNVPAPEVIVSPTLQSPPGATWDVKGKDGNGRAFSFTVTRR